MGAKRSRVQAQARAGVLPLPAEAPRLGLARFAPSARSIAAGVLLLVAGAGAYVAARQTSLFAVRTIEIRGAPPVLERRVRDALEPLLGKSLVAFDAAAAVRRLDALPDVASARFDRDFPHTLRVVVHPERPVAVLRRGSEAWVVSARGRVLSVLTARPYPRLPRIWVPRSVDVSVDATLSGHAAEAVQAVAPLREVRFSRRVAFVRATDQELTLVLASGQEVRLGDPGDVRLKLAVAGRILPLAAGARYVDVSVPERSVAGFNSQVAG